MKTEVFEFNIDARVMPSDPVELRGKSRDSGRMIVLNRDADTIEHTTFSTICDFFLPGDLLVLNDSYTLANTLSLQHGDKPTRACLYGHEPDGSTIVEIDAHCPAKPGLILTATDDRRLTCTLLQQLPDMLWKAKFKPLELLVPVLEKYGQRQDETVDLNPKHWKTQPQAYRPIYAKKPGSLDIPSAGLHFSRRILDQAVAKGVEVAYITLHVGATETLADSHISEDEVEKHKVRSEYFEVSSEAAGQINQAQAEGRRVVAVGTTVMRTLETLAEGEERTSAIKPRRGWTDLYIYPGFDFAIVDVLLTNLHQPRSSHIVLTAAFAGTDFVMRSYEEIVEKGGYEFDMFGDSMLIM